MSRIAFRLSVCRSSGPMSRTKTHTVGSAGSVAKISVTDGCMAASNADCHECCRAIFPAWVAGSPESGFGDSSGSIASQARGTSKYSPASGF